MKYDKTKPQTKLAKLLEKRGLWQADIQTALLNKFGYWIGSDRISEIVRGKRKNHMTETIIMIAAALEVTPNDIIEFDKGRITEIVKKYNQRRKATEAKKKND